MAFNNNNSYSDEFNYFTKMAQQNNPATSGYTEGFFSNQKSGIQIPKLFNGNNDPAQGIGSLTQGFGLTKPDGSYQNIFDIGAGSGKVDESWWNNSFLNSDAFKNTLTGVGLGLNAYSSWQNYKLGKDYLNQAKENLAFEKSKFNETYNNALKQYNTALADRLRARAAFETGNSNAYNDEIAANSMQRGQTGNAGSDYLNYKRSANA